MRMLSYGHQYRFSNKSLAIAAAAWILLCAIVLARALNHPNKQQLFVLGILAITPIAVLRAGRIPIVLLAAYAALVPFSSVLHAGGDTVEKFLGMAVAASLVLAMMSKLHVTPPSRAFFVLLALTVYSGLTICWAIEPVTALSSYEMYLNYVGMYAVIAFYPASEKETRLVISAAVAGAVALAGYGAYLYSHGQQVYESRLGIGFAGLYWIDSNEYAAAMLAPISVLLVLFLRTRVWYKKLAWFAVFAVSLDGFAVSGSRGGMFALGAIALFFALRSKYRWQVLALAPAIAIALLASPIGHRLSQGDLASGDLRFDIWKVGLASLQQYWVAGAGIGNFNAAFAQYFLSTPHAPIAWDRVAHSILIQSAVELGIPGLLILLGVWYTQFAQLNRATLEGEMSDIAFALQGGVLGLFVAGLSLNLMVGKYTWLAFALVAMVRSVAVAHGSRAASLNREAIRAPSPAMDLAIET